MQTPVYSYYNTAHILPKALFPNCMHPRLPIRIICRSNKDFHKKRAFSA